MAGCFRLPASTSRAVKPRSWPRGAVIIRTVRWPSGCGATSKPRPAALRSRSGTAPGNKPHAIPLAAGRPSGINCRKTSSHGRKTMLGHLKARAFACLAAVALAMAAFLGAQAPASAQSGNPIRIGFGMALTGPLAANGKSALLAMNIWKDDVNANGGLLGRPVELVCYDDQSNPSTVPGLYTERLDIDRVDLILGGYATNMLAPAMPVVMQKKKVFIGLLGLAVNTEFEYPNYFAMIPSGPETKPAFTKGFFDVATAQSPKPQTVAIVAADAEFSRNAADGARENAKAAGLKVVYDRNYPPSTTDFAPIVRAVQAANPDLLVICSYPLDSVGMIRAINEIGFKPKMVGGAMVGLQATAFKTQLGPLLNGVVNYDFWLPVKPMDFPGVADLIKKYQARAQAEG